MKSNRVYIAVGLVAVAIFSVILFIGIQTDSSETESDSGAQQDAQVSPKSDTEEASPINPNDQLSEENQEEVTNERPGENEPSKVPTTVNTSPVIYTGYGHNEAKPLPSGQKTSTTCTTDSNVECTLKATNVSTGEVYTFPAITTDAEGVALWEWTGGEDLSSGTWKLTATAGDKSSNTETIYVQ